MLIVVCNNTNVSKAVFDYIAGYETGHAHPDGEPVVAPGAIRLFSNEQNQRWLHRPHTILVDSRQLEAGESMSADFKKLAVHQFEVQTAKTMWVPGVNNLGTFGRWSFLEIDGSNLHKTKQEIRTLTR